MNFSASQYTCPSCGAALSFRAGLSVFAVCKYCNATLLKKGASLEKLGQMAELLEDFSVLQLGTIGRVAEGRFSLIGRIRLRWERGTWDEWYLIFETGKTAWLAEAQGWYALSFQETDSDFPPLAEISLGTELNFGKHKYRAQDFKKATCVHSEGELPFTGAVGEEYFVLDCSGPDSRFASLAEVSGERLLYLGHYYTFDQLNLEHLRKLDGW